MKRLLLFGCSLFATFGFSQTTLFQDNFQSGSAQWTLNTGSGDNNWVVNNVYLGYAGLIPDTPNQPVTFTGGTQSTYMHITNQTICGFLNTCNANFDTGSASNQNAEIATSINASGLSNVTVSFWYLCAGQAGTSFGTMEYSIDGGATWVGTGTNYVSTSSWTQETVSLPAWDNASAFKIRYKWQNGGGGLDPAFSVDEILITGSASSNSITTGTMPITSWCFGSALNPQIQFTATGTYNAGNVFTAQLSDASGSFASPTNVGSLTSSASGTQSILTLIPGTIPVGSGYRIRVVSSSPATIGSDNGVNLQVFALPTVTLASFADICENASPLTLTGGSPAGGTYSGTNVSGGMFNPTAAGPGTADIYYSFLDGNGCSNNTTEQITVLSAPNVQFSLPFTDLCIYDSPYTFTEGTPAGGTYAGPGVVGGVFDPGVAGIGAWSITYEVTGANGCTTQTGTILQVTPCSDLVENESINYTVYPNPASDLVNITTDAAIENITLIDLNGKRIKEFGTNNVINVSGIDAGVYMLVLSTPTGEYRTKLQIH